MAYIALYEFALGEVVFIPLGLPPHKRNEAIAPAEHRLSMLRLATQGEPRFSVDTIELNRSGFTYTVDTLEALCIAHTQTEYYYIIGADTLYELKGWRRFERVIELVRFICVLRPGVDDTDARIYAEAVNAKYGQRISLARDRGPDISSTLIRDMAAEGHLPSGLLPKAVAEYIRKNHIYSQGV